VVTDLGQGRNVVNVLTSRVVVAVGAGGPGTASEVALALKYGRPVVLLAVPPVWTAFFASLGQVAAVETVEEALRAVRATLGSPSPDFSSETT
jgi:predicted Rossmann-fold nucleotide-binding protein